VASSYNEMLYRIQISAFIVFLFSVSQSLFSQRAAHRFQLETSFGDMKCILFEETPMHAENFVKLFREGYYDGVLFHRVIRDFMIQTGDPDSKNAQKGEVLGHGGPDYTIPAEFHPDLYHRKGVLASARQGDQLNPGKESNGSQFYIVQGKIISDAEMDAMEANGSHIKFTNEQRMVYRSIGGTPHLDYSYTVFGEVTEGLEVLDKIASLPTDNRGRPHEDVKIISIKVLK
jgi:cyclophilin family peptidyl-prolyl cis-trans isomerase